MHECLRIVQSAEMPPTCFEGAPRVRQSGRQPNNLDATLTKGLKPIAISVPIGAVVPSSAAEATWYVRPPRPASSRSHTGFQKERCSEYFGGRLTSGGLMRNRLTPKEEEFVRLVIEDGHSFVSAYRLAYPPRNGTRSRGAELVAARRV